MKIQNDIVQLGINRYQNEIQEKRTDNGQQAERSRQQGVDRIELSLQRRQVERLKDSITSLPAGNRERVNSLRSQVAMGTYRVSGIAVADKMLSALGQFRSEGE